MSSGFTPPERNRADRPPYRACGNQSNPHTSNRFLHRPSVDFPHGPDETHLHKRCSCYRARGCDYKTRRPETDGSSSCRASRPSIVWTPHGIPRDRRDVSCRHCPAKGRQRPNCQGRCHRRGDRPGLATCPCRPRRLARGPRRRRSPADAPVARTQRDPRESRNAIHRRPDRRLAQLNRWVVVGQLAGPQDRTRAAAGTAYSARRRSASAVSTSRSPGQGHGGIAREHSSMSGSSGSP
jgi:hypothetical protein